MEAVRHLCFSVAILTDIWSGITRLITGLISLKESMGALYDYMRVLLIQRSGKPSC